MAITFPAGDTSGNYSSLKIYKVEGVPYGQGVMERPDIQLGTGGGVKGPSTAPSVTQQGSRYIYTEIEIHIPLPKSGLTDNYNMRYDDARTSAAELNLTAAAQEAAKAAADTIGIANTIYSLWTGTVVDPDITPLFKGIDLRTFSFTWDLFPRNEADAASMISIVSAIKQAIKPTFGSESPDGWTSTYLFPHAFGIEFFLDGKGSDMNPLLPDMRSMKGWKANWVCTNISIEAGAGAPLITFGGGVVTAITLKMDFKEITKSVNTRMETAIKPPPFDAFFDNKDNWEQDFGNPEVKPKDPIENYSKHIVYSVADEIAKGDKPDGTNPITRNGIPVFPDENGAYDWMTPTGTMMREYAPGKAPNPFNF